MKDRNKLKFRYSAIVISIILLLTTSSYLYKSSLNKKLINERKYTEQYLVDLIKSKYIDELNHFVEEIVDIEESYFFKKFTIDSSSKKELINFFKDKINLNKEIFQLRLIDERGKEFIRVDNVYNKATVRKKEELQDKSDRYYFKEAQKLNATEIYISPIDINIEKGLKGLDNKTIRIITPVNIKGRKYYFVVNYYVDNLVSFIKEIEKPEGSDVIILNGNCKHLTNNKFVCELCNGDSTDTIPVNFTKEERDKIDSLNSGQILSEENLITFNKILVDDLESDINKSVTSFNGFVLISKLSRAYLSSLGSEISDLVRSFDIATSLIAIFIGFIFYKRKCEEVDATYKIIESDKRFKNIFNNVGDNILIVDWDYEETIKIILMNQKATETFKSFLPEVPYNIFQIVPKTESETLKEHFQRVRDGKDTFLETKVIINEKILPVEANIKRIVLEGNSYFLIIVRDISERKEAEAKIKENELKYRALFEANNVPMLLIDPETNLIVDANDSAEDFYGWRKDELKRMKIDEINTLSEIDLNEIIQKVKNKEEKEFIFKHRKSDGTTRDVEVSSSPIIIEGKELLVSIIHDISDRKQIEESIELLTNEFIKFSGKEFFDKITDYICKKFHLDMVMIGRFEDEEKRVKVLSCFDGKSYLKLDYYDLTNTPCANVKKRKCNLLSENVSVEYPDDEMLVEQKIKSYWGFALQSKTGDVIGLVVLLSKSYIYNKKLVQSVLNVFIESIASEIEREIINNQLNLSEEKFRKAFNSSLDALTITTADRGIYLEVNDAFEKITGYKKEEVIGQSALDINIWYDLKDRAYVVNKIKEEGYIENFTCKFVKKSGEILYGFLSAIIIEIDNQKCLLMIARDVTEIEIAKQKIFESEKKYRVLFNRAPIGILVTDAYMKIIDFNNNLRFIFNINGEDEILNKSLALVPCFKELNLENVFKEVTLNKERVEVEIKYEKEKEEKILRLICSALTNQKGVVESVYFGFEDTTEKVKIEKELEERKFFIENIVTQTPNIIYIYDLESGKNIYINKNLREVLGYNKNEMPEDSIELIAKIAHPEDLRVFENFQSKTIEWSDTYVHHYEIRLKDALGRWRWFWGREKKFKMEGSKVKSLIGFLSETTTLKEKELRIRENEKKFRYIYENSLAGLFESTIDGTIVNCNNLMANIYGYSSASELKGTKAKNLYLNEEQRNNYLSKLKIYGRVDNHEMMMKRKDGKVIWVMESASILENGNIFGACFEITNRKIADEKIKNLTSHLTSVYESSNMVIFSLDKDYKYLSFNSAHKETMLKIWGVEIELGKSMLDYIKDKNDRKKAKKNFDKAMSGESFVLVEEYGDKKLHRTFYENSYSPLINYEGEIIGLTCFIRDVTQRIKNELLIKKLSDVVEQNPISVVITDVKGNIEYVNSEFCNTTGYKFAEVQGKNPRILKTDFHNKEFYKELWDTILTGKTWNGVFKNKKKDGTEYWEEAIISPILDNSGKIINFCALKTDITEKVATLKKLEQSEKSYRALAENSPLGIVIHDHGRILFASEKAVEMLKAKDYTQLKGKYFNNFLKNETDERIKDLTKNVYKLESLPSDVYKLNTIEGNEEIFYAEMLSSVIYFKDKKVVQSVFYDITERIRLREALEEHNKNLEKTVAERTAALKQSEEKFRALAEHSKDVIMRFDLEKRHIYVNPIVKAQTGISPEEFIGKTHKEMNFPEDLVEIWESALDYVIENKKEHRVEFKLPNNIWIDWLLVPEFNEDGSLSAVVTSARDITRIKEASQKYKEALKKEKSLNEMKTEFLSRISHEFKTPLTSVYSSIELLERYSYKWEKPKIEKHYYSMKKNIENLRNLIDELLMLTRIEKKQFVLNPKIYDLNDLIDNNIEPLKPLIKENMNLVLQKNFSVNKVMIDEKVFSTIFSNLLSNAIKYSPEGGEIKVTISDNNNRLNLIVKDQGLGIPEKDLDKLFERFFRSDNIGSILGSGLGLTIVKSYIDELKGTIKVKSELGKGSEFTVSLPVDFINE